MKGAGLLATWLSNRSAGIALEMSFYNAIKATHSDFKINSPVGNGICKYHYNFQHGYHFG